MPRMEFGGLFSFKKINRLSVKMCGELSVL